MRASFVLGSAIAAIAATHGCGPGTERAAGLPTSVVVSAAPVTTYALRCMPRVDGSGPQCLVETGERATAREGHGQDAAFAYHGLSGSTVTTETWMTRPERAAARTFTLVDDEAAAVVTSNQRAVLYSRMQSHGAPADLQPTATGTVGYVVPGDRQVPVGKRIAIDGAHADARHHALASTYFDVDSDSITPVSGDDDAWRRAHPERRIERARFEQSIDRGAVILGHVDVRLESIPDGYRCVSFRYVVDGRAVGEVPCARTGPPYAILVVGGVASWVFSAAWTAR